jgi:predicted RecB family nuclease
VLQLSLYSDLVGRTQGLTPQRSHVIAPWSDFQPQSFRTDDFAAYYRRVRTSLQQAVTLDHAIDVYPDPKPFCEVCRWQERCEAKRHADDHLSLVASISKSQITELFERTITTGDALATLPIPLTFKPTRGSASSLERVREQARIQAEGKKAGAILYERLPPASGLGLARLYEPSPGDIFFDLEGDPFVGEAGLEYLFGYSFIGDDGQERYVADWALSRAKEHTAFERFIDFVMERLNSYPNLHIYHFAPYEPAALKRLMGRYATREDELDQLLRGKRFVDLFAVARQGLRASVESYSIKRLEPLYGYQRATSLPDANQALAKMQAFLELGDASGIGNDERQVVEAYNRDDCQSTWRLRDWLETLRTSAIAGGDIIDRPSLSEAEPSQALTELQMKIAALEDLLTSEVPDDPSERTAEQHGRWILAHILDWHRREKKVSWWEYFRLADLPAEDLLDERAGLADLTFEGTTGGTEKAPVHRYRFPPQETELRGGEAVHLVGGAKFGQVESISVAESWIEIKKRKDSAGLHPEALFAHNDVDTKVLAEALLRMGEYAADNGLAGEGRYQAARDILLRIPPRVGGQPIRKTNEPALAAANRLALALDAGVLAIQGPPGSGKTYTGARMIVTMVGAGLRVGITANSHKVIRNLLDAVCRAADESGIALTCILRIPTHSGHRFRFEAGHRSDLMPATIPK